jgi:DNA-binding beta-propeller fold protein YncE
MIKKFKQKAIVISCLFLFLLVGCRTLHVKKFPEKEYFFYPSLPNSPRFQYLTTFSDTKDIEKKKSKFFNFIAGDEFKKDRVIQKAYGIDVFNGVIYVCDIGAGAIVTLDLKKNKMGYIGNSGNGKLLKPVNIKIDKALKYLYVADMGRKQVVLYNLQGKFIRAYGKQGEFFPSDVDIYQDFLYICDVKKHMIQVINKKSGKLAFTIGKAGSKKGELFHPTNICIADKKIYVSNTTNFRIEVFDLKGKFLTNFGRIGDRPGTFTRPKGVAVDRDGRILVVDSAFENVQIFNKEFRLLLYMLGPGIERQNINLPAGISIDYDNLKYFREFISPNFNAEYLFFVTSNFGRNKVNVYAYGIYEE